MSYRVKEIFASLQGEGMNVGRAAVFLRFAGCNLWSGREEHRSDAVCRFCDTDFVGTDGINGGTFAGAEDLALAVEEVWTAGAEHRLVVCTGGEPLLQLDADAIDALHERGFTVAVETNGTRPVPRGVDWLCVSPKEGAELVVNSGDELKLVYPQEGADPFRYEALDFDHFLLSPMDTPELALNTKRAIEYCADHPRWRLTIQAHKYLGIR